MKTTKVTVNPQDISSFPEARVDLNRLDATGEQEIQDQINHDTQEAMADMGAHIRSVRERVGMTQTEFAQRIGISVDTLRNWEQGRRYPTGTARALLRIIDRAPELAVAALK